MLLMAKKQTKGRPPAAEKTTSIGFRATDRGYGAAGGRIPGA